MNPDAPRDASPDEPGLPDESGPERTCIVTRSKGRKDALIRFVIAPDKSVAPDIRARLPGRGAWVKADRSTVELAMKRRAFARAFKTELSVTDDLPDLVDRLLETDALQALSIANKAGLVTTGSTKVEKALADKRIVALVHAAEAGPDGVRKVAAAAWRRFGAGAGALQRVQLFGEEQLDLALGRTHVIHAALAEGAASDGFIARSRRLERFRGLVPLSAVGDERDFGERDDARGSEAEPDTEHAGRNPQSGIADE